MSQKINHEPHFFNPGMSPEELEDWLNKQRIHVAHFNQLVRQKAALEEQLVEVNRCIEVLSASGFKGKQSFP